MSPAPPRLAPPSLASTVPRLAAIAVVPRSRQILLVRRRNPPDAGLWGFPGGHVDLGETALAAAARETREETGIIVRPRQYLTNIDVIRRGADDTIEHHFLLVAVLCDYLSGNPAAADDVFAAEWVDSADILAHRRDMSADVDRLVRMAMGGAGGGSGMSRPIPPLSHLP